MADNINTYMGNAALGQGTAGGEGAYGVPSFQLVNDAVDKMMMYRFYQNRDEWARKNVLADRDAEAASKALTYEMGDWLPGDTKAVQADIENVTKIFNEDPSAVTLKMDPRTGKFINAEQFSKLQEAIGTTNQHIKGANGRKQQMNLVDMQGQALTDEDDINDWQTYRTNAYGTPIDQSIPLWANMKVNDLHSIVGPDVPIAYKIPFGNYFDATEWTAVDVEQGVTQWKAKMQQSSSWNRDITRLTEAYEGLRAKAVASLQAQKIDAPTADQIRNEISKDASGRDMLNVIDNNNAYAKFQSSKKDLLNMAGVQPAQEVDLTHPIDVDQALRMYITGNAKKNIKEEQTPNMMPIELQQLEIQKKNAETSRSQVELQWKQYNDGNKSAAQMAQFLGAAETSYIANLMTPQATPQNTIKGSDINKEDGAAGYLYPTGGQINDNDILIKQVIDQNSQNMFRLPSGQKQTVRVQDPLTNQWTYQTVSSGDYQMSSMYIQKHPDANGNINDNDNHVIVQYVVPHADGKKGYFSNVYSKDKVYDMGYNMFDDGTAKGQQMSQVALTGYQQLLKQWNVGSPDVTWWSQGTTISAPAVTPGIGAKWKKDAQGNYLFSNDGGTLYYNYNPPAKK